MSQSAGSDEPPLASQGQRIAHYRILSRLGEGGMGVVYRAEDTKLRRTVALKVLHPEVADKPDRRKRFLREGRLAGVLTHPCIATVYDVGESDDRIYIAMELVEGEILGQKLKRGSLPYQEALRIAREIARGLTKAHEAGVIHRDLKPDNVMVGPDGIVKILDFGVAKPTDTLSQEFTDIKTQHGSLVGTPAYMSPEQASGKSVDARSDIFSVGVLLYEMLAGKRPFLGDTWQEIIISINRDSVELVSNLRPEVPPDVDHILARCLAKSPADRYNKARELAEELTLRLTGNATLTSGMGTLLTLSPAPALRSGGPQTPAPESVTSGVGSASVSQAAEPPDARRSALIAMGLGALVIVAIALGFGLRGATDPELRDTNRGAKNAAGSEQIPPSEGATAPTPDPGSTVTSTTSALSPADLPPTAAASPSEKPTSASAKPKVPVAPHPAGSSPPVVTPPPPNKPKNPILGF